GGSRYDVDASLVSWRDERQRFFHPTSPFPPMSFSSEKVGDVLVVSTAGQINSANAAAAETALLAFVDQGEHRCVLNMAQLDYISSAGLRVILMLAKRLKQQGGKLVLCSLQAHVLEVFDISGFLSILTVVEGRDTAIAEASR